MDRVQAITWVKQVQAGQGVSRSAFPDSMKGSIAKHLWDDATFTYGIEYGVLIALFKIFDLTEKDFE